MKVEIDQSGKVEYTSTQTVVGDSLKNYVLIRSGDKRLIQEMYRQSKRPKMFVLELFSLLTSFLIKSSYLSYHVYCVDIEYPGRSDEIKHLILKYSRLLGISLLPSQIQFKLIGKKSRAHKTVHDIFTGKTKSKAIRKERLLKFLFPQKRTEPL